MRNKIAAALLACLIVFSGCAIVAEPAQALALTKVYNSGLKNFSIKLDNGSIVPLLPAHERYGVMAVVLQKNQCALISNKKVCATATASKTVNLALGWYLIALY